MIRQNIVVFTGAGISSESGLHPFDCITIITLDVAATHNDIALQTNPQPHPETVGFARLNLT